ncbi:hypothetical protein M5K25_002365 [Dendrobium thyrsiflorum]|uniref:BED-type domain-containing protein n=1 Tax=Dendrobium thyrsiflorum TaxID=117978 RepID=A0ABD0VSQ6_DENTH
MSTPVSIEVDNCEPVQVEIERLDDQRQSYVGSEPMNENDTINDNIVIDEEVERWATENQDNDGEDVDEDNDTKIKKRKKTSKVWDEFKEVILPDGQRTEECYHCKKKKKLYLGSISATTQFMSYLDRCAARICASKK